ncbi:hypothetical protein MRQ36_28560 [Micromonospora sp. R77]|nr:hypothetical protein [Micromonospora sp. R77]MCI4066291.1 hypothetical protein [Micromonospora sp. R77]
MQVVSVVPQVGTVTVAFANGPEHGAGVSAYEGRVVGHTMRGPRRRQLA